MSGTVCRKFIEDHAEQVSDVMRFFGHETLAAFLQDCLEEGLSGLTLKMHQGCDSEAATAPYTGDERMSDEEFRERILKVRA